MKIVFLFFILITGCSRNIVKNENAISPDNGAGKKYFWK